MPQNKRARIVGMGSYLPERILTNQDLEKMVETSDEWIVSRTGVRERRIAADDEFASDMGLAAAQRALEDAGVAADEVEMILVATATPDYLAFPSTAAIIQDRIGATKAGALDIEAACSGHVYGLSIAKAYIESGMYKNVLVISSEKFSSIVNYKDRNTCVLFGDGASAAVVADKGAGFSLDHVQLGADGSKADVLIVPAGGCREPATQESVANDRHYIQMEGREVFKNAVRRMESAAVECLEATGASIEDIVWLVPHQANVRIIDAVSTRVGFPDERVYKRCVQKYGNNSAASVGIGMDELVRTETIHVGDRILVVAFGAGFTYGGALLTKIDNG